MKAGDPLKPFVAVCLCSILLAGCSKPHDPIALKWEYTSLAVTNFAVEMHEYSIEMGTNNPDPDFGWRGAYDYDMSSGSIEFPEKQLKELGEQGWEMVGSYPQVGTVWPDISVLKAADDAELASVNLSNAALNEMVAEYKITQTEAESRKQYFFPHAPDPKKFNIRTERVVFIFKRPRE
jgi:hypothetical protein